jgi:flagellar biosynthesis/type III secretory pathway protein FliH
LLLGAEMRPTEDRHSLMPKGTRRIPARLWDAEAEARRRLDQAEAEARALLDGAMAEADALRAEAASEGREQGLASARELLARAALERDRLLAAAEPLLVEVAFTAAQRVLSRVVERDREAVIEVASRALEVVRHRVSVTIRVHPDDLDTLREREPRLLEIAAGARAIALVGDAAIERGGAVIVTEAGTLDAQLSTQLEGLRRAAEVSLS